MNKVKTASLMIIFTCLLGKAQSRYTCTCESQKANFILEKTLMHVFMPPISWTHSYFQQKSSKREAVVK